MHQAGLTLRPARPVPRPSLPAKYANVVWGSDEFHDIITNSKTLQQQFWEWYGQNPARFLRDCIKIIDKERKLVPLDVSHWRYRRAQTYFMEQFLDAWWTSGRVRMTILKARQWGCT